MRKIAIAITGASGSIYAKQLLEKLIAQKNQWNELSVVMTENAKEVWKTELENDSYNNYPITFFSQHDFSAPFASGSGQYDTMIIIPCSMGTLGRIAGGISDSLITRSADVILKERRKLICVVRDMPVQFNPYKKYGNNNIKWWNNLSGYAIILQQTKNY